MRTAHATVLSTSPAPVKVVVAPFMHPTCIYWSKSRPVRRRCDLSWGAVDAGGALFLDVPMQTLYEQHTLLGNGLGLQEIHMRAPSNLENPSYAVDIDFFRSFLAANRKPQIEQE